LSRSRNPKGNSLSCSFLEALNGPLADQNANQPDPSEFQTFRYTPQQEQTEQSSAEKTEDWKEAEAAIAQHNSQRQNILKQSEDSSRLSSFRQLR